jgi:glycosyltransferase involved in cell wall biosynthesis
MTIGMFSPYLPKHFGGGERHFLTTAAYLSQRHNVEILLSEIPSDLKDRVETYQARFDLDLSAIKWRASRLASGAQSAWATWRETAQYDAFFHLTDGSLFLNGSARGILHVQVPFTQPLSLANQMKLKTWHVLNTNSQFTKRIIERSWRRTVDVVHAPFVDTSHIPEKLPTKHPEILTVGRFIQPGSAGQNKRQDVLIHAFISGCLQKQWPTETVLHVVGALEPGSHHQAYLKELQQQASGYPVKFHVDVDNDTVLKLYKRCQIYWHATGFEIDEFVHPELTEHFGMTPLEAMAWGCIPIVVPKGGVLETIDPDQTGLTYQTSEELIQQTTKVLQFSTAEAIQWQARARASAERYSLSRFCQTIDQMLKLPQAL